MLEKYISKFPDYQIALDRMKNKDDEIISSKEMRAKFGIERKCIGDRKDILR